MLVCQIGNTPHEKFINLIRQSATGPNGESVGVHLGKVCIEWRTTTARFRREFQKRIFLRNVYMRAGDLGAAHEELDIRNPMLRTRELPSWPSHVIQHVSAIGCVNADKCTAINIKDQC